MLFYGNISGHDFSFHVESWMDVRGQWREGILFPRWAEWANWGFGEPRFIFYPPLSWMIGAALGSFLPWKMAPGAFIWLALTVAGLSMWRLAREALPEAYANLAAVLYATCPYHLVMVYYRSAFGELLAAALLPLLLWATLRIIGGESRKVPILALILAGIWLSDLPAAVIATYSLAIAIALGSLLERSPRPLLLGFGATAGGLALAACFVLPAAWEQAWVQIEQVVSDNGRPSENFLFTHTADPFFRAFNWKVSWVAVGLIVVAGVAALVTLKKRAEMSRPWWVLSVLGLVSTGMMLPPSLWLWRELPKLWFIQFPWRWLDILDVAFAFFAAAAIARWESRIARWTATAAVLIAIGTAGAAMLKDAEWDSDEVSEIAASIQAGRGYEGTDEYAPVGCDRYQLPGNPDASVRPATVSPEPAPPIGQLDSTSGDIVSAAGVGLATQVWTSTHRGFTADSQQPVTVAPRLLNYPAWDLRLNGQQVKFDVGPETGQILVPLRPGTSHIEICFHQTWDRTAGDAASALAAIALGLLALGFRPTRHRWLGALTKQEARSANR
ncbi:MAG TPA: 6-pyruvoyl-tetrahydropterin synthase-related protein [Candidatus Acidoferrales bacterium]|nr:6-pyruvoyl-tetrahydropterin synthase-related protein [Candidatus Acidoferrales bacterium]